MRKKLLIFLPLFSIVVAAGAYLYAKSQLPQVPEMTRHALAKQGIRLDYASFAPTDRGLGVSLREVSISGKPLPFSLKAKNLSMGIVMKGWPLFRCFVSVSDPILRPAEAATGEKQPTRETLEIPKTAALLAPFLEFDVKVENASGPEWSGLSLEARGSHLSVKNGGLSVSSIHHEIMLASLKRYPWLPAIRWEGQSSFSEGNLEAAGHHLVLDPVRISIDGKISLPTKKWAVDLSIPQGLKISARGTESQYQLEGKANIKDLELALNTPSAKGKLILGLEAEFSKITNLKVNGRGAIDATQLELNQEKQFHKPAGVPLSASFVTEGSDAAFKFSSVEARLSNLVATSSGEVGVEEPRLARVSFHIAPTELSGWERFFPEYRNIQTQGTLQLDGKYEGPAQDWRAAIIEVALKARGVHMPILSEWTKNQDFSLQGLARVDSDTTISLAKGILKTVSTASTIDLRDTTVKYGALLHKPRGTPFLTEMRIQSTDRRAEIKKGIIALGPLRTRLTGSIENFLKPFVRMKFDTDKFEVARAIELSPGTALSGVSGLRGSLTVNGRIEGPLADRDQLPKVEGFVNASRLAMGYKLESTGKNIQLRDLSGPVQFTNTSIASKGIRATFPKSDIFLAFQIQNFSAPQISFKLQSSRFSVADFYDLPKSGATPGVVPIPVSAKKADDDFRKNPFLRNARVHGSLMAKNLDLGYAEVEAMQGTANYDRLLLKLEPFKMKVFGGWIQSALTWDGRAQIPTTVESLDVQGVDANRFLSSYSDKAKDVLDGKLSARMNLKFSGMGADEIKKTAAGTGDFQLSAATFKTIRFTQKPLESLKKVPFLSKYITKTEWSERFNDVSGKFTVQNQNVTFSNLIFRAGIFDLVSPSTFVDFDANMKGTALWYPKGNLLPAEVSEIIRDEKGVASLPLVLAGPVRSPNISPDTSVLEPRFKSYLARKANAEKDRAISAVKEKAGKQIQDALKKNLGNIFK